MSASPDVCSGSRPRAMSGPPVGGFVTSRSVSTDAALPGDRGGQPRRRIPAAVAAVAAAPATAAATTGTTERARATGKRELLGALTCARFALLFPWPPVVRSYPHCGQMAG